MAGSALISKAQRAALSRLSELRLSKQSYLAGGVAVAFHLRHRRSIALLVGLALLAAGCAATPTSTAKEALDRIARGELIRYRRLTRDDFRTSSRPLVRIFMVRDSARGPA